MRSVRDVYRMNRLGFTIAHSDPRNAVVARVLSPRARDLYDPVVSRA